MPRFSLFIEAMKRGLGQGIDQRHRYGGTPRETLLAMGTFGLVLWKYLTGTLREFAALHARFVAGTLATAPRRRTAPRPEADRPTSERTPPSIPPGPVFLRYCMVHFVPQLQALLGDPEMQALLAASPQAGRLLRPLWRKLTFDPLPEVLRLPRKPKRQLARPESRGANPSPRPLVCSSQPKPTRGEGEGRRAWVYPVSLWPDPAPAAEPPPALPAWPPPLWSD